MMFISVASLFEALKPGSKNTPANISHCVLAVKKKGHTSGEAWNICRSAAVKNNDVKEPFKPNAPLKKMRMTQQGSRRAMKHGMEKGSDRKFRDFQKAATKMDPKIFR